MRTATRSSSYRGDFTKQKSNVRARHGARKPVAGRGGQLSVCCVVVCVVRVVTDSAADLTRALEESKKLRQSKVDLER